MNLVKLVIGVAILIGAWLLLPILDILQAFLVVVCVPLVLLVAIGMVSESSYELFRTVPSRLKARIEHWREELEE